MKLSVEFPSVSHREGPAAVAELARAIERIGYDQQLYKAVVRLRINSQFDRIPKDSDASIMTSGLLGGQYIGITPGGAEDYLKQGDRIEFVQDAFVLENLINQLASTFLRRDQGSAEGGNQDGNQDKAPAEEPKR